LREIAAASDFDFVAVEPRRPARSALPRGKSKKASPSTPAWLAAAWRYRTPVIGVSALVLMLGAIVVNAMFMQKQKHPAPLFGATFQIEPPRQAAQPAPRPGTIEALLSEKISPSPLAPVGPAPAGALTPPPVAATVAAPAPAAAPTARAEAAPAKKNHDAIGALISAAPAAAPPVAPSRTVMSAQRALQKLGMVVNPDGRLDATTRKALEIFQHDNHLPANGELTAKTRMMLSALSGVAVE
jgi:hypothetical protein